MQRPKLEHQSNGNAFDPLSGTGGLADHDDLYRQAWQGGDFDERAILDQSKFEYDQREAAKASIVIHLPKAQEEELLVIRSILADISEGTASATVVVPDKIEEGIITVVLRGPSKVGLDSISVELKDMFPFLCFPPPFPPSESSSAAPAPAAPFRAHQLLHPQILPAAVMMSLPSAAPPSDVVARMVCEIPGEPHTIDLIREVVAGIANESVQIDSTLEIKERGVLEVSLIGKSSDQLQAIVAKLAEMFPVITVQQEADLGSKIVKLGTSQSSQMTAHKPLIHAQVPSESEITIELSMEHVGAIDLIRAMITGFDSKIFVTAISENLHKSVVSITLRGSTAEQRLQVSELLQSAFPFAATTAASAVASACGGCAPNTLAVEVSSSSNLEFIRETVAEMSKGEVRVDINPSHGRIHHSADRHTMTIILSGGSNALLEIIGKYISTVFVHDVNVSSLSKAAASSLAREADLASRSYVASQPKRFEAEVDVTAIASDLLVTSNNGIMSVLRYLEREYDLQLTVKAKVKANAHYHKYTHSKARIDYSDGAMLYIAGPSKDGIDIFMRTIREFLADPSQLSELLTSRRRQKVHVYCDASNIAVGIQRLPAGSRSSSSSSSSSDKDFSAQIDPTALMDLVAALRDPVRMVVVGSAPPPRDSVFWRKFGAEAEVAVLERVARESGHRGEQAVDDVIHAAMLQDINSDWRENRTMVLLSGDGNTNHGRTSFPDAIDRALRRGWSVEVWSWKASMSGLYSRFREAYPGHFKTIELDPHRDALLFKRGHTSVGNAATAAPHDLKAER